MMASQRLSPKETSSLKKELSLIYNGKILVTGGAGFIEGWFAGFVEGEGSFTHRDPHDSKRGLALPVFSISQKNRDILVQIQFLLGGIGHIYSRGDGRYIYTVRNRSEVEKIRSYFEKCGFLHEDKRKQFNEWKKLFKNYVNGNHGRAL